MYFVFGCCLRSFCSRPREEREGKRDGKKKRRIHFAAGEGRLQSQNAEKTDAK